MKLSIKELTQALPIAAPAPNPKPLAKLLKNVSFSITIFWVGCAFELGFSSIIFTFLPCLSFFDNFCSSLILAIISFPSVVRNIFSGLRSRWIQLFSWITLIP